MSGFKLMNIYQFLLLFILISFLQTIINSTQYKCPKKEVFQYFDSIVIGGGIIGSGIGYKLALTGKKTVILEKGKLGHKDGSSHGGSRMMRYTHSDPIWLPLVHDAYGEWEKLQKKHGAQIYKFENHYAFPRVDFNEKIRFCTTKQTPKIEGPIKKNEDRPVSDWMVEIPKGHITRHLPWVNSTTPAIKTTCVVTMTTDSMWIIDRHPEYANIYIAGGFSGTGFKYALTVGKLIVQMMAGVEKPKIRDGFKWDMAVFSLNRK